MVAVQAPYYPPPYVVPAPTTIVHNVAVPGMPGMPPLVVQAPGLNVQIHNVAAAVHAPMPFAQHPAAMVAPPATAPAREQSVLGLMQQDASLQALEAVAQRGPARVLAFGLAAVAVLGMFGLAAFLGASAAPLSMWLLQIPLALAAVGLAWAGVRASRSLRSHALEPTILRLASEHGGQLRVVALAQASGRTLRECQVALDAMVASGHATVDADDRGGLVYRIPDLEPVRVRVDDPMRLEEHSAAPHAEAAELTEEPRRGRA